MAKNIRFWPQEHFLGKSQFFDFCRFFDFFDEKSLSAGTCRQPWKEPLTTPRGVASRHRWATPVNAGHQNGNCEPTRSKCASWETFSPTGGVGASFGTTWGTPGGEPTVTWPKTRRLGVENFRNFLNRKKGPKKAHLLGSNALSIWRCSPATLLFGHQGGKGGKKIEKFAKKIENLGVLPHFEGGLGQKSWQDNFREIRFFSGPQPPWPKSAQSVGRVGPTIYSLFSRFWANFGQKRPSQTPE